jgi:GTPase Era involved in 16S rRNA processing
MQDKTTKERIKSLQKHLAEENPLLVSVVDKFIELDRIGLSLGVLNSRDSYTTEISWWPLISILGTFSAGKSSFINQFIGENIQKTGNQAVDDKFTVLCFSSDNNVRVLPGIALDADPRFPFYQMSEAIEKVAEGEGERIDTYLQLKTCPTDVIRGRILIDSPGFDADAQRRSTLRITDHIINLSDLVLVFFDARHPEPGAMQDTLEHLVAGTVRRKDANKIMFILNQIDTTAAEDNLEAVVAAWQRAIAQGGLVSGSFHTLYNESAAVKIEDESLKQRYERKRDADLGEITKRISQVSVERAYRIIGALESFANRIEKEIIPEIETAVGTWRRRVMVADAVVLIPLLIIFMSYTLSHGYWSGMNFSVPGTVGEDNQIFSYGVLAIVVIIFVLIHFLIRGLMARIYARGLAQEGYYGNLRNAFLKNTQWWRSIFSRSIVGWSHKAQKKISQLRDSADNFIQKLNDQYTNPSGKA